MNRCTEFGRCAAGVQGGVLAERSTRGRGWNRCAGRGQLLDEQGASQALLVVPLCLDEVNEIQGVAGHNPGDQSDDRVRSLDPEGFSAAELVTALENNDVALGSDDHDNHDQEQRCNQPGRAQLRHWFDLPHTVFS